MIGVQREHRIALGDFTGTLVDPRVPQASQSPGYAVGSTETPPNVATSLPTGLIEGPGWDDAALAMQPRVLEGCFARDFLEAGVVGRIRQLRGLCEPWNQAPLPDDKLTFVSAIF